MELVQEKQDLIAPLALLDTTNKVIILANSVTLKMGILSILQLKYVPSVSKIVLYVHLLHKVVAQDALLDLPLKQIKPVFHVIPKEEVICLALHVELALLDVVSVQEHLLAIAPIVQENTPNQVLVLLFVHQLLVIPQNI